MLAGGLGKGRMDRNGGTRPRKTWRLLILSSGEISVAEHMLAAQKKARAGQEVRLVDVPADAGASLGVFDTIFDFASGAAFANYLTEAVRQGNALKLLHGYTGPRGEDQEPGGGN